MRKYNIHITVGTRMIVVKGGTEYMIQETEDALHVPQKAPPGGQTVFSYEGPPSGGEGFQIEVAIHGFDVASPSEEPGEGGE